MSDETDLAKKSKLSTKLKKGIKRPRLFIGILIVIAVLILVLVYFVVKKDKEPTRETEKTYSSSLELARDNLKTDDDVRNYVALLQVQDNYEESYNQLIKLVNKNVDFSDAKALLTLCVNQEVDQKEKCIELAEEVLTINVQKLDFYSAYSSGGLLEKANRLSGAKLMYQRAIDVYIEQPLDDDVKFMTKAELTNHISGM